MLETINKPERIIKRIIKAVGQRQSVLLIGNWEDNLIKRIQENENIISHLSNLPSNSFTRIVADYNFLTQSFFYEARRLLLPTGMIIISANCEENIFEKLKRIFTKKKAHENIKKIKPKILQDLIHDNGFLIDGYYGYPGGHLLMVAQIQNKEVTTLFTSEKQETINI